MSDRTSVPVSPSGMSSEDKPPGRLSRLIDALAHIPLPVVGVMLVLGAALSDVNNLLLHMMLASGAEEGPQWVARLTLMQYNLLIPVALLALWARRRTVQGRLGATAAVLIAFMPVVHLFLTACSLVWGLVLGRGDMSYPFMYIEFLILPTYIGIILTSAAWMRDRPTARLVGPMIFIGLVLHIFIPWAFTVIYAALAFVIISTSLVRKDAVEPSADVS
jgi:hypothetical protein